MKTVTKHQTRVFALTFMSYALFSLSRLPYSVSKSTLEGTDTYHGWAPFNDPDKGATYLGMLDSIFLISYAGGLVFSGRLGDHLNLRYFLPFGMLMSGVSIAAFGFAQVFNIHAYGYFVACNVFSGLFQAIGWPANVTLMGRWFSPTSRGSIMGLWCSQSAIGMIIGKQLDAIILKHLSWDYVFIVSGIIVAFGGLIVFLFLEPDPAFVLSPDELNYLKTGEDPSLHNMNQNFQQIQVIEVVEEDLMERNAQLKKNASKSSYVAETYEEENVGLTDELIPKSLDQHEKITFINAVTLPGVIPFALCLFFSKLVAYAFVFWLPSFLSQWYSPQASSSISSIFDAGGIAGGILAGYLSDRSHKKATVCVGMALISAICLYIYSLTASSNWNIPELILLGIVVNGPYTLISSAISADLASHPSLFGNPTAMSTVTGFIDGVGTLGAVAQGIGVGILETELSWDIVFYLLAGASVCSALMLVNLVYREWKPKTISLQLN